MKPVDIKSLPFWKRVRLFFAPTLIVTDYDPKTGRITNLTFKKLSGGKLFLIKDETYIPPPEHFNCRNALSEGGLMELTTFTLMQDPGISICRGHVDRETFIAAFTREWKAKASCSIDTTFAEIKHEWWRRTGSEGWTKCAENDLGALPVTVMKW